jgi:hypothetical protein
VVGVNGTTARRLIDSVDFSFTSGHQAIPYDDIVGKNVRDHRKRHALAYILRRVRMINLIDIWSLRHVRVISHAGVNVNTSTDGFDVKTNDTDNGPTPGVNTTV